MVRPYGLIRIRDPNHILLARSVISVGYDGPEEGRWVRVCEPKFGLMMRHFAGNALCFFMQVDVVDCLPY